MLSSASLLLAILAGNIACRGPASDGAGGEPRVLTLATTTSTENSGLLAHIHPDFTQSTGIELKVVAKGTGAALRAAREGDVDAVLVHAPELEEAFVAEGWGVERRAVMYNDFVVLGPPDDPAGARGAPDAASAFKAIHDAGALFVSRGDDSGTHVMERTLWKATGLPLIQPVEGQVGSFLRPDGEAYHAVGEGMGHTIHYATEKRAYTLSDRGTYYAWALDEPARTDLVIVHEGDELLMNPYHVMAVNPDKHPHVQRQLAQAYIDWITSPRAQELIGSFQLQGKQLFVPSAGPGE